MSSEMIHTKAAPQAIGTYSQAVKSGNTVYLSGQIGLDPETMKMLDEDLREQIQQVFRNLSAVCTAAGGSLADIVKLTIYILDFANFALLNEIMAEFFSEPYPARAVIGVASLPKNASIEIEGIMQLD